MILRSAHGLIRRLRSYVVIIALLVLLYRYWSGGFWSDHRISESDFAILRQYPLKSVPSKVAGHFCRQHGWKVFSPRSADKRRKVYDLSMINNELDWLEIRLNSTYDAVDYFVLVEGSKTFTGLDKPLFIKENWDRFAPYKDKIIYHELEYPRGFNPQRFWDREDLQRDAMYLQVFPRLIGEQKANYGDVMVVADVDEIPRPETLLVLRTCDFPRRLTLRSRFYYYSFQFLHRGEEWKHPQATYYRGSSTILPVNLRNGDGGIQPLIYWEKGDMWNAAWHCSSCYQTMEGFLRKLSSFSHAWMNQDEYRNRDKIADSVRNGKDLWNREGEFFDRIDDNKDVPRYLLDKPDGFQYLLDRGGETAGFTDYPP